MACGGYGVGLVWPGQKEPRGVQRRILLDRNLDSKHILGDEMHSALEALEEVPEYRSLHSGPFSVFHTRRPQVELGKRDSDVLVRVSRPAGGHSIPRSPDDGCLLFNSMKDRQLMHYWVTFLSGLMTPTPRPDNAFRDIITPLALSATSIHRSSPGHVALLHSLYALAAFSHGSLCVHSETPDEVGIGYMEKCLRHLSRSLTTSDLKEQQAILATILMLGTMPAFTNQVSDWRTHLRGGNAWLRSVDTSAWRQDRNAVTIYQLFLSFDVLRPAHGVMAKDLEPQNHNLQDLDLESCLIGAGQPDQGGGIAWSLDRIWGITRPTLQIIHQINQWVFKDEDPPPDELQNLQLKLVRSDPSNLRFAAPDKRCQEMTRCHARAFYYACHIYLNCSLLKHPPRSVRHFVRQSIEQIEAIALLEMDLNVSGILWPAFITACEAEDVDMRTRIMRYFERREMLGLANVTEAKAVVLGVWDRRDSIGSDRNVFWHDVMAEMGIDIILS